MLKNKIIKIAFLMVCVAAILVQVCACSDNSRTSLSSFVSVSNSGVSGRGTATVNVDWDGIKNEVLGSMPSGETALEDYNKKAEELKKSLSFVLDKASGLSNGESVTVTIICEEKAAVSYNIKVYEGVTFVLDGFLDQIEVDLFKELEVMFTGFSPNVVATIENKSQNEFLKTVKFTADKTENLAFGDEIVVTANYSEELAETLGYVPLSNTKKYKVQDVAYYPYSYSELPTELVRTLTTLSYSQVNDRWKDYKSVILSVMGSNVDRQPYLDSKVEDIQIKDPVLTEIIVLSRSDTSGSWFGSYNYLFFVYKTVVNDNVLCKDTEIYQCVVFSDVFVDEEGVATYSQWNTEKPQYETAVADDILTILQKEYSLYDSEVVLK